MSPWAGRGQRVPTSKSAYYKSLFFIGGLWNLGGAIPSWLGAIYVPDFAFGSVGMAVPGVLFPYLAMYSFIITFGIGYIIVSRDIAKNHGIVVLGIIGKTLFFVQCAIAFASNEANLLLLLTGIVDVVFAALFLEFLLSVRRGDLPREWRRANTGK